MRKKSLNDANILGIFKITYINIIGNRLTFLKFHITVTDKYLVSSGRRKKSND